MRHIRNKFTQEHLLEFSTRKTVVKPIQSPKKKNAAKPNVYVRSLVLSYVTNFKYLGHMLTNHLMKKNLSAWTSILWWWNLVFSLSYLLLMNVYLYALIALLKITLIRLKVCHRSILRSLMGLPVWASANHMFAIQVRCFRETCRVQAYRFMSRIDSNFKVVWCCLRCSKDYVISHSRQCWREYLHVSTWYLCFDLCIIYEL